MTARTITPAPYSFWARTSQMKSGTPMNRTTVSRLGMVATRSWSTWGRPGRAPAPMNFTRPLSFLQRRGAVFRLCLYRRKQRPPGSCVAERDLVGAEEPAQEDHQDRACRDEGG